MQSAPKSETWWTRALHASSRVKEGSFSSTGKAELRTDFSLVPCLAFTSCLKLLGTATLSDFILFYFIFIYSLLFSFIFFYFYSFLFFYFLECLFRAMCGFRFLSETSGNRYTFWNFFLFSFIFIYLFSFIFIYLFSFISFLLFFHFLSLISINLGKGMHPTISLKLWINSRTDRAF